MWKFTASKIDQSTLKNKTKVEETTLSNVKNLLYGYSNKDSVVLMKGQTHKSMEQNREPRNQPTQICPTDFWQDAKKLRMLFSTNYAGQIEYIAKKTQISHLIFIKTNSEWTIVN